MPVNPALRSLATDGRFSLQDAQRLQQLVETGSVTQAEAKEALQRYGDVMDPEAGRLLESFTGGQRSGAMSGLPAGLVDRTVARSSARSADAQALQRALMTLGQRQQNPALTLPSGVDGVFGNETASAVRAFQSANGITPTGVADPATLRALDNALRGEQAQRQPTTPTPQQPTTPAQRPQRGLSGQQPVTGQAPVAQTTTPRATPQAMVEAAEGLATGPNAASYGVPARWINNDPRHAAPVDRPINGTADRWKCNLFAGNAMVAAGFEPPYYGNRRTGGEYPNANQLYKWSDKYAARFGNANNVRFTLGDEMRDMPAMTPEARRARLEEMFSRLQPGDLLIADHVGTEVADGGHCRVYLGRDENGQHRFAQASQNSAEVQVETVDDVMGEEHLWILRPNTPRRAG